MYSAISSIQEIISELREGNIVILLDEENRENEGDLLIASEFVTPDIINFMITNGKGLICLTITEKRSIHLGLSIELKKNYGTNFTKSIDSAKGIHTGISVLDRTQTIQTAISNIANLYDFIKPGHMFPVCAVQGGIFVRSGHTEAGCYLTYLAGLTQSAVICEILKTNGNMARLSNLFKFSKKYCLKIGTINSII